MRGFGDLEAAIMDVVWASPDQLLVRDVWTKLKADREIAYTTVQTVMDILHRKRWLDREKRGRAYVYWPAASREDYAAGLVGQVLEGTGDRTGVLVRLFEQMDPAEVAELRAALDELKSPKARTERS